MILIAKAAGADCAKFQVYDPRVVLDPHHPDIEPWWDLILATELDLVNVQFLKRECDLAGIEFLASVFEPEKVAWLEKIGVKRYKIASRSVYNEELLQAIGATQKPVLVSYSTTYLKDVDPPLLQCGIHRSRRLYCVSEYPTPLDRVRFREDMFDYYAGWSDHTVGITAAVMAMSLGARIIEKHFTLSREMPGPDHVCSIEPRELKQLCHMRDEIEVIRGH
jgi:N-acetylneuraminate synthase/N,N'-diacetyllegionaminate synthase